MNTSRGIMGEGSFHDEQGKIIAVCFQSYDMHEASLDSKYLPMYRVALSEQDEQTRRGSRLP